MTDFKSLRELLSSDPYDWNHDASFGQNLIKLFERHFYIPDADIQIPILAAYATLPSALCTVVPILWIEGSAGSGKSLLLSVYGAVYSVKSQNASWTFASIRNEIELNTVDSEGNEKHYMLCLDNLNEETFRNENLYTLFLCGYDRNDSITAIAVPGGENLEFNTFCPKVVTTIHGILSLPRFSEIKRRTFRIFTKRIDSSNEAEVLSNFDNGYFEDIRSYDLSILNEQFQYLWRDGNHQMFLKLWRQANRTKFKCGIPQKKLSLDLVVSGVIAGVWKDLNTAIAAIDNYWSWIETKELDSPLVSIIKDFISQESVSFDELGIPVELNPKRLKSHIQIAANEGLLDCFPNDRMLFQAMQFLGWQLDTYSKGTRKWRKIK